MPQPSTTGAQTWRLRGLLANHGRKTVIVTILVQVVVLLLGMVDYATGVKLQFAIIYLAPVSFAALRGGLVSGVVTSAASTAAWFLAQRFSGGDYGTGWVSCWNALGRLAGFSLMAIFLARSHRLNNRLSEKAQSLSLEIEKRKRTEKIYLDEKEILQFIACDRPLNEILETLTRKIEEWYEGMLCSLFLFDGQDKRFVRLVAPSLPQAFQKQIQLEPHNQTLLRTSGAKMAAETFHTDLLADPAWADFRQIASAYELCPRSSKAIISATGDLLGFVVIFSHRNDVMVLSDLALFEKARAIASIAIERSRLNKELRKLSEMVINAQEAERRRIARDLHDSVNQLLSTVTFRMGMIGEAVAASHQELTEDCEKAKQLLTKGIDEIHRISEGLRPSELDALGLAAALRSLCREFQQKTKLKLRFDLDLSSKRLSDGVELTLYRIIQEALNNIEKHSGASEASLRLAESGPNLNLTIHDNGKGLEALAEKRKSGMGLLNMRERAAFLGGTFSIRSTQKEGTEIAVRIPLLDSMVEGTELRKTDEIENQSVIGG